MCNIHPWMRGNILIRDNPYMAKTDADGRFSIENLPTGNHTFQLWHERVGYLKSARFGSRAPASRGRITLKIRAGDNELHEARLAPSLFEDK